ncbi:diguanylate cyclase [Marinobacter shengliensis]|uniref:diguanylate cyclase n=1 Tax=Marinobacter shengliensis TaxID=1389223 RepID=UPI0025730F29|nr:diguanylate cyclase [Marinobacter shengliensis]
MSNIAVDHLQERLRRLQERFLERARGDIETLSGFASLIDQQQLPQSELDKCYQLLHRMAGSSGTFGFPELGQAARAIEKQMKSCRESAADSGASAHDVVSVSVELADELRHLARLLEKAPEMTSATGAQAGAPAAEDSHDGAHGMQVNVMALGHSIDYLADLVKSLAVYGFVCESGSIDRPSDVAARLAELNNASILLCVDSELGDVMDFREQYLPKAEHRRFPVVCVGHENSFETLYRVAERGATAYFCEPLDMPELAERIESLALERGSRPQGRVLIVDDDLELGEHYCLVLKQAGIIARLVSDPADLMSELSAFEPDLVLMDVQLRDYSGVTLARLIRYEPRWLGLPIVYLSSEDNPENQLDALSKGADEFLVKPVTDDYLVRSVRIRCYRARQLSDLMNRDSLTGLLKHSLIKQEVDRELARCRRAGHTSCVVMLDLDHFKRVNDSWGHGQGDIVIRTLANLLRNRLRESDVIGRYGGEEFLLILPDCEPAVAVKLIEAIGKSFAELAFWAGDDSFQVTLSAGVALINDFPVSDQAIEAADQALYQRKRGGRNGVTLYDPSPVGMTS